MSIRGVTHDMDGRVVQRLAVTTKVAIGLPPDPKDSHSHPTKLDRFAFLCKKPGGKGTDWEIDANLTKHYGEECRELKIVLIDDDIENIFPTSYAWWTATECKCRGDGQSAVRRTQAHPEGEPWPGEYLIAEGPGEGSPIPPCGDGCPDLLAKRCKPSGDLRFILADFPSLGSVCRIHTSSYRSIRQIYSALQEIQSFTGGRLAGLCVKLVVKPEQGVYRDNKGQKKTTTIYALSLDISGTDFQKLLGNLTQYAQMFSQTQKLLAGRVMTVDEKESDKAPEIAAEFYTPDEPEKEANPVSAGTAEPPKQQGKAPFQISGKVESVQAAKSGKSGKKFLKINIGGQICYAFEKPLAEKLKDAKDKFLVLELFEVSDNGSTYLEVRKITGEPQPGLTNPAKAQPSVEPQQEEAEPEPGREDEPLDPPREEALAESTGALNVFAVQTFNDLTAAWGYTPEQVSKTLRSEWNKKDIREFTEEELEKYILPFFKAHSPKKQKK